MPEELYAGVGEVNISPEMGIHLAGAVGLHRPAKLILDPLFAKAIVMESGGKKACLISTDLCIISERYTRPIRSRIADMLGIGTEAVILHAVQTHTAPALGDFILSPEFGDIPEEHHWLRGSDKRYESFAVEGILKAVELASSSLQPLSIGADSGCEGRVAFNRRMITRDRSIAMPSGPQALFPIP